MKLFPATVLILLVLFLVSPYESEAVPPVAWFVAVAAKLGVRLIKNAYYARCNTRYVPPGINCPGVVYGMGMSRRQAQNARELTQVLLEILGVPPTWDIARSSGSLKEEESKSAGSDTTKWKILDIREL